MWERLLLLDVSRFPLPGGRGVIGRSRQLKPGTTRAMARGCLARAHARATRVGCRAGSKRKLHVEIALIYPYTMAILGAAQEKTQNHKKKGCTTTTSPHNHLFLIPKQGKFMEISKREIK